MVPIILTQPVRALMRPVPGLPPEASVEAAASALRESGASIVLLFASGETLGAITEASLADALARGVSPFAPATEAIASEIPKIGAAETGAEALRRFSCDSQKSLVVVDERGRPIGLLAPSDLWPKRERPELPSRVGGMATPFGVYLTTGAIRAGAGDLALVCTGMLLFGLLLIANIAGIQAAEWVHDQGWGIGLASAVSNLGPAVLFMLALRVIPLSRIHAAEHKVVHAIERGEELNLATVRRMPRVHPRCGTNIAVAAALFFGLATWRMVPDEELRLALALVATLIFWRPLGALAQKWITTREPSDRHIDMGIRSGRELIRRHVVSRGVRVGVLQRIWNTGMLHVIAGSAILYAIALALAAAFGWNLPL